VLDHYQPVLGVDSSFTVDPPRPEVYDRRQASSLQEVRGSTRPEEEAIMSSFRRSGWLGLCLLLGAAPVFCLAALGPVTSAAARVPSRCTAPPHAGADYAKCNLTGADFTGADLEGADLKKATLTDAIVGGADLAGATLTDVISGGITGTPASLPAGWTVVDGYLVGPQADLTRADLSTANLTDADLFRTNLTDADLSGANLTDATIKRSKLQGTDLGDATLTGIVSGGAITGSPASLPSGWTMVGARVRYLVGPTANLARADFYGADLAGTDLADANLSGANMTYANLTGADLSSADLTNVVWSETTCPDGTISNNDGGTCVNNLG
jgi:uncharacterized protein YjbI with pentapeptide repeats